MFKFFTTRKTKVIPIQYELRKDDGSLRSINSVLPEPKLLYERRHIPTVKII